MVNKLVVENLKHRPVRTFLSMFAIGVEVTMVLTLVGLSYGMLEESARRTRGVGADIIVRPPFSSAIGLSGAPMPEAMMRYFTRQPNVASVAGTVVETIVFPETMTGLALDEFEALSGTLRFREGGAFQANDDVIVDEFYARQRKLHVGDQVELKNRKWRICGIVEAGKLSRVFVQRSVLQDLTGNTGKLSQIYVKLDNPANLQSALARFRADLKDYQIYSTEELVSLVSVDNIPGLKAFIYVIIGLAVVIGFLVVFLSMYTAVLERTREIGILKAIGASRTFVLSVLLRETLVLALMGSVVGIALSFGSRWLIMTLVPASLQQKVMPEWWPITTAIAVAGAVLGTLYPAWKAAKQDAIEALAYD